MRIDNREASFTLTARSAVTPQFGIRVAGVEPQIAEKIRRRVIDLMGVMGGPSPAPAEVAFREDTETIQVGLIGPSDPMRKRELEQQVRTIVAEEMGGGYAASATLASSASCVCYGNLPAEELKISPDEMPWFDSNGVWQSPPDGSADWLIAVFLDFKGWNAAALLLSNGATLNPPVPKNQVLVGLANKTSWPKEIWADNLCSGRVASVYHETSNPTFRRMLLDAPNCYDGADTIVFRKPGLFGIWHEVCHIEPNDFWKAFGGTRCDFTWVKDF